MLSGRPHVQEGHPAQLMCPLCSACLSLDGDGTPFLPWHLGLHERRVCPRGQWGLPALTRW